MDSENQNPRKSVTPWGGNLWPEGGRPFAHFPWRVALRQWSWSVGGLLVAVVVTGYSLRLSLENWLIESWLTDEASPDSALAMFDQQLTVLFVSVLGAGLLWTWLTTYWSLRPLARVLRMTKAPRSSGMLGGLGERRETISESEDQDSDWDEPGEWMDLERSLLKLGHRLHKQGRLASREREELTTILGSVSDAIVAMDLQTQPLYFNSRFALMFGGRGESAESLSERFRSPELLSAFQRVLKEAQTRTIRVRLRTALHEGDRTFSVSVSPLLSVDREVDQAQTNQVAGQVYGAVAIFHDISELKQAEQIRIDFVANASHELKTPLTSIKGYIDTIRDDLQNRRYEEALPFVDVVRRNVDRLMQLVNDLLELSRMESGAEVKKEVVSTVELTEHAIRQVEGQMMAMQKRQRLIMECQSTEVLGDARLMEQVIVNLLHNAIKYVPEGGEIRIVWEPGQGANQGEVVLRVVDQGPGIAEEHLPRLFERFYRVDAGRAREVGGTGLGLAIVKHIVLAHGGNIAVRSKLGEGSEFICRFPRK